MNSVVEIGRMVADPEVRYTQDNLAIARFKVAVDRKIKNEGQPTADFIPCKAFGKTAEFIEKYFKKGRRIGITGRINTGDYTAQDGTKVYYVEVIAESAEFVDNAPTHNQQSEIFVAPESEEDLPWS